MTARRILAVMVTCAGGLAMFALVHLSNPEPALPDCPRPHEQITATFTCVPVPSTP